MKKQRKGFTIVELVIVIAVIAILAAVLIPTFSSIINKANISSDMQAVREMNIALKNAQTLNGKPKSVDFAMEIIAAANYDVASFKPLSKGLEIYWVDTINRVILYEVKTSKVIYPEGDEYSSLLNNDGSWHVFNESYKTAVSFDFSTKVDASQFDENGKYETTVAGSTQAGTSVKRTFTKDSNGEIESPVYTIVEAPSYASLDEAAKTVANKAAGEYLYALAVQINEGMIKEADGTTTAKSVTINLPKTVDVSEKVWKPIRNFTGTIAPAEEGTTSVVTGLNLDTNVSFESSATFLGSANNGQPSKYNVVGFIASVTGDATISNVTFENVIVDNPCSDYTAYLQAHPESDGKVGSNANVFGVIGGIIPDFENDPTKAVHVTIDNVDVEDSNFTALGRLGGVVGYIGGAGGSGAHLAAGSVINIINCDVTGNTFRAGTVSYGYGSLGGLVSYMARYQKFTLNIDSCNVEGNTFIGNTVGGLIGWFNDGSGAATVNVTKSKVANNIMMQNGLCADNRCCAIFAGKVDGDYLVNLDLDTFKNSIGNALKAPDGTANLSYPGRYTKAVLPTADLTTENGFTLDGDYWTYSGYNGFDLKFNKDTGVLYNRTLAE